MSFNTLSKVFPRKNRLYYFFNGFLIAFILIMPHTNGLSTSTWLILYSVLVLISGLCLYFARPKDGFVPVNGWGALGLAAAGILLLALSRLDGLVCLNSPIAMILVGGIVLLLSMMKVLRKYPVQEKNPMKKRVSFALAGLILLTIGAILITEGGFRISHIAYDDLPKYEIQGKVDGSPCLTKYSRKEDAVISVYADQNSENTFYILEFARNTVFNRYSLADTHIDTVSDQPFHSVVSTAFYDYPYRVDLSNGSIEIFEGTISGTLSYSLFLLSLGTAVIVYGICSGRKKP